MSRALKSEIFNACKRWVPANCSKKILDFVLYVVAAKKKKNRIPMLILHFNLATRHIKTNTFLYGERVE